jgi:cysteinyl-tRNA synthetase
MTDIKLWNSKSRRKEVFQPRVPGRVSMYVCGPTVYDRAHLGNARPVVVFDVLNRLMRHVYGAENVTYVRNFTDVDDKINAKAAETGRSIAEITDETIAWYHADMGELGALPPTHEPRATQFIPQMVAMIQTLIAGGHAYAVQGHVLFRVRSYKDYGALSGRSVDDMIAGARVEVSPFKEDPMDFVLWKPSDAQTPGWDSPWGRGRPGWHIECSAMSYELLGTSFDIHGGGLDLQFPHHENELAQSACAHPDGEFARVWMHNEMLQVEGKKMSKSLGNFFTVRDLLDAPETVDRNEALPRMSGDEIRLAFMMTHYRKPMDLTVSRVGEVKSTLEKWQRLTDGAETAYKPDVEVVEALADDLNTPLVLQILHKRAAQIESKDQRNRFRSTLNFLGIGQKWRSGVTVAVEHGFAVVELLDELVERLGAARRQGQWAKADELRGGLKAAGVNLKISRESVVWEFSPDLDAAKLEALR